MKHSMKLTRFQSIKLAVLGYFKEGGRYITWGWILAALLLILVAAKYGGFSWQGLLISWSSGRFNLGGGQQY